ncbi:MAG: GMC family oxidoreductase [Steroidobacteraceae bacterium]|nr:GMC family oxidoreductase [Steroidobacteraceae bacterium]
MPVYDQVVIGSGFGGAVAALRLSEKGYRVLLVERGKRWRSEDFPATNMNLRRFLWLPRLGLTGTWKITPTRRLVALGGSGLGGGSLVYANTVYIPGRDIFESEHWRHTRRDWYDVLLPFYGLAQRMLGVGTGHHEGIADRLLDEVACEMGRGATYQRVDMAVLQEYQRREGAAADPYFNGDGPARHACNLCAGCMVGCRYDAKNTLDRNYLYFAERNGVEVLTEAEALSIRALPDAGDDDGSGGYEVLLRDSTGLVRRRHRVRTQGVVVSAGTMGTLKLLFDSKHRYGGLSRLSAELGARIRCNSETFYSVDFDTRRHPARDIPIGVAVNASFRPDDVTMIEPVRFGAGSDAMYLASNVVPLTDAGRLPRPLALLLNCLRRPLAALRLLSPFGKSRRSVLLMIMQSTDAYVHARWQAAWTRLFRRGMTLVRERGDARLTTHFPIGQEVARRYAAKAGGAAGNLLLDILADVPASGHIMGGATIGAGPGSGVVDHVGRVFGYRNLRVLDGSIIPGNLAVNPSLTILALAEYAMSRVPVVSAERAGGIRPVLFSAPLPGSVSALDGAGNLLERATRLSRAAEMPL